MMDRCYRQSAKNYKYYGDRGIRVCDEWHDIETFAIWCEHSGYKSGLTIDRINVNDNYSPSNCRWVTRKEQANNRRNTVYVTIDGITKTLTEWAEFAGLNKSTLKNRYCDGVRGVMLLHKSENTKFKKGYNKYDNPRHYKMTRSNLSRNFSNPPKFKGVICNSQVIKAKSYFDLPHYGDL